MSAKSELIKVLTNYRNAYEQVRAQIDQIRKNPDYTEEGKVNLIDPIVTNFVPSVDQARQAAAAVIQGALEALDSFGVVAGMTGGAHLRDAGYQAGLANVLHMLEIGALDADEVRRIAKEYEGDYAAIATMRKLCAGRGWLLPVLWTFSRRIPGNTGARYCCSCCATLNSISTLHL